MQLFWKSRLEARLQLRSFIGIGAVGEAEVRPDMTELVICENTEVMAVGVEVTGLAIGGCFTNIVVFSEDPLLM